MTRARTALALLTPLLALAACARGDGPLRVEDAWVRAAPGGVRASAAYMTIVNDGDAPRSVVGVTSTEFADATLHETRIEEGMVRMRPVAALPIGPGLSVSLAPGGVHVMLEGPVRPLAAGERAHVTLRLDDGSALEVDAEVRAP
jgi:periplasmic copper chaperone A